MKNNILKLAGSIEEIDIRCPKCNAKEVVIILDKEKYYTVSYCEKCGFKNTKKLI